MPEAADLSSIPPGVDPTIPSIARMYDYYLGGDHWYEIDKHFADLMQQTTPALYDIAHNNRIFLRRAVRWLARRGIDQFLDIGSGLPTTENTHQVAHQVLPNARVVYVDSDPTCAVHAKYLLDNDRVENVGFVSGDATDPDRLLNEPDVRQLIDFDRPVGLLLVAVLHGVPDSQDTNALVRRYVDAMPSGSYLALSHFTADGQDPEQVKAIVDGTKDSNAPVNFRTHEQIAAYFDGLEMVLPYADADEPRLVWVNQWQAAEPDDADPSGSWLWSAVARKA